MIHEIKTFQVTCDECGRTVVETICIDGVHSILPEGWRFGLPICGVIQQVDNHLCPTCADKQ